MKYGYARVSSAGQALYGNSLEAQERELRDRGCQEVYKDVYTGTKSHRPQLDLLLSKIQEGDELMVTKLDRLGRTAENIITLIRELVDRGISVNILNMGVANNSATGRLMITILSGFAEFEHDMILTRFEEGKAQKKSDPSYKEGRKEKPYDEVLYSSLKAEVDSKQISVCEACKRLGISRGHWYRIAS